MFKCERCGKTTKPREKMIRYPIEFRDKVYQREVGYIHKKIITTYGNEIVKEIAICENCYNELNKE